jgi:hypothetical protein
LHVICNGPAIEVGSFIQQFGLLLEWCGHGSIL